MSKRSTTSPTEHSPDFMTSTIRRRAGSDSARNIVISCFMYIHYYVYLCACQAKVRHGLTVGGERWRCAGPSPPVFVCAGRLNRPWACALERDGSTFQKGRSRHLEFRGRACQRQDRQGPYSRYGLQGPHASCHQG